MRIGGAWFEILSLVVVTGRVDPTDRVGGPIFPVPFRCAHSVFPGPFLHVLLLVVRAHGARGRARERAEAAAAHATGLGSAARDAARGGHCARAHGPAVGGLLCGRVAAARRGNAAGRDAALGGRLLRERLLDRLARLVRVAPEAVGKLLLAAAAVARAAVVALHILKDDVVNYQRDHEAAAHVGPVGRADDGVADDALGGHVARAHEAHVAGSGALHVAECVDGQRVAHDGHAVAREVGGRVARDLGEARGGGRKRLDARRPDHAANVLATRTLGGLHGVDLHGAAVDAQRKARVVDGLARGVDGRQPLGALERDGAGVLAEVVGLGGAEKLVAVLEQELVELGVEIVEAIPDALVDLDGKHELVGRVDGGERGALKRHLGRVGAKRRLVRGDELERGLGGHRVDIADAVARLHELEADVTRPHRRQRLDNARRPAHFLVDDDGWSADGRLTELLVG